MIEVKNINMSYGDQHVLKDINLKFEKGQSYAILGQSGCGKSTLLRIIAGLLKPTSGIVSLDGKEYHKPTRDIFMMHQNYANFPWKNSLENVLTPLKICGKIKECHTEVAKQLLKNVGLEDYRKFPYEMSGGMNQRLALARAIISNPPVLLMDEPTSALDEGTCGVIEGILTNMQKQNGTLMITVTHSEKVAQRIANTIIRL